jgi:hypothetical protein
MSVSAITEPVTPLHYLDDYDRASELVRNELGGVALATPGKRSFTSGGVRGHKAAVVREVARSPRIRSVTQAFRVVDAAYPFFSLDDQCTEEAVTAACGPLYGGLSGYRVSTAQMLRAEARTILTRAIATLDGAR